MWQLNFLKQIRITILIKILIMTDFYDEYFGNSSQIIDTWLNHFKVMMWDFLLIVLYVIICFLIYKIIVKVASRFLKITKINQLNKFYEKIDLLKKIRITIDFQKIILAIIKFFLVLIFIVVGADLFNMPGITKVVNDILSYVPKLVSGIAIIMVGFYIANWVKQKMAMFLNLLENSSGAKVISNIVVFGITLFFILMGLNQAGIDTTVITNNISIILGVIFASIALSFGLGSKDIVKEILYSYYLRKSVEVGNKILIEADDVEGNIISIDNINVKISSKTGIVLYPIKKFVTLKIEILN